ncbi:MAG: O-methyltransferase [Nocardioides sp.]
MARVALFGSASAVVGAVAAAWLSALEVAVTALGIALLGALALLVLLGRTVGEVLDASRRQSKASRRRLAKVSKQLKRIDGRLAGPAPLAASRTGNVDKALRKELLTILAEVQKTPSLTVEMGRAYDRLVDHQQPMPALGGWALSPSTMLWLLDHLVSNKTRTVLECGSGSSTIWIATTLERVGGTGSVTALESSEEYAAVTRAELERLGLAHRATVIHAPLVEVELPDRPAQRWFDVSGLDLDEPVDLLVVDGPVRTSARLARYPAYPLLVDRLAPGATVLLDDTHRPSEAKIAELWTQAAYHGRRLVKTWTTDRSTIFVSTEE